MSNNVQEVFGQFATEIAGKVQLFETAAAAQAAFDADKNASGYLSLATAYTDSKGLVAKNAVGKINIITDFLAFAESYVAPVVDVVDEVVAETEVEDPSQIEF